MPIYRFFLFSRLGQPPKLPPETHQNAGNLTSPIIYTYCI